MSAASPSRAGPACAATAAGRRRRRSPPLARWAAGPQPPFTGGPPPLTGNRRPGTPIPP